MTNVASASFRYTTSEPYLNRQKYYEKDFFIATLACTGKSVSDSASSDGDDTETNDTNDTIDTSDTNTEPTAHLQEHRVCRWDRSFHERCPYKCAGSCFIGVLEGNAFTFRHWSPEPMLMWSHLQMAENALATPIDFIEITTDVETHALEQTVLVNEFVTVTDPISSGDIIADGGLTILADANGFTPRDGYEDYTFIASVKVDPTTSGLPLNSLPEDIVGLWQLGAFEAHISPSWSFQVENSELPTGYATAGFNASYDDIMWKEVGTASVDDNGNIVSDEGTGIEILSALVITQ